MGKIPKRAKSASLPKQHYIHLDKAAHKTAATIFIGDNKKSCQIDSLFHILPQRRVT